MKVTRGSAFSPYTARGRHTEPCRWSLPAQNMLRKPEQKWIFPHPGNSPWEKEGSSTEARGDTETCRPVRRPGAGFLCCGEARRGVSRFGEARRGVSCCGEARRGVSCCGEARHGVSCCEGTCAGSHAAGGRVRVCLLPRCVLLHGSPCARLPALPARLTRMKAGSCRNEIWDRVRTLSGLPLCRLLPTCD